MGRPRSFDRDAVLDRAMGLFWRQGYGATSVKDILAATGLNPGSLYEAFGDKHGLFLESVARYRRTVVARRLAELRGPGSPRRRIEDLFEDLVRFSVEEGRLMGCLMTNSAIELAPHDRDAAIAVAANVAEMEAAFRQTLKQARAAGEIGSTRPAAELARYLTASVQGLRVMAKVAPEERALRGIARTVLSALD